MDAAGVGDGGVVLAVLFGGRPVDLRGEVEHAGDDRIDVLALGETTPQLAREVAERPAQHERVMLELRREVANEVLQLVERVLHQVLADQGLDLVPVAVGKIELHCQGRLRHRSLYLWLRHNSIARTRRCGTQKNNAGIFGA